MISQAAGKDEYVPMSYEIYRNLEVYFYFTPIPHRSPNYNILHNLYDRPEHKIIYAERTGHIK